MWGGRRSRAGRAWLECVFTHEVEHLFARGYAGHSGVFDAEGSSDIGESGSFDGIIGFLKPDHEGSGKYVTGPGWVEFFRRVLAES